MDILNVSDKGDDFNYNIGDKDSMKFMETELNDVKIIEPEKLEDDRGFFARIWDKKIFRSCGLNFELNQCSISFNKKIGTFRGMHYQGFPYEEDKLVKCTKGKIFDIIVDLRPSSSTYKQWKGFELTEENHKMAYIPKGFAHGFQTLSDNTEVFYQISQEFMPNYSKGFKWNDPTFEIKLPLEISAISEKDKNFKSYQKE